MSATCNMEDEDVILNNSPLYQYLSNIHFDEPISDKIVDSEVNNDDFNQFSLILFEKVSNFINFIMKCCFARNIDFLLNYAQNANILDDDDDMCLKYLIDTRNVQSVSTTNEFRFMSKVQCAVFIFAVFCSILIFDKVTVIFSIIAFFISILMLLIVYSYTIKHLTARFYDKIVTISRLSRQLILLIQELLSINQGYARVVHIKEDEHYDCSQSFNTKFLQELCKNVFTILSNAFNRSKSWNDNLQKLSVCCPPEVPWLDEQNNISFCDLLAQNLDINHPMSGLKSAHNLVQIQFSFSIKRTVLLIYSLHCHLGFEMPMILFSAWRQCEALILEMNRFIKILEYRTKSNLTSVQKTQTAKLSDFDVKIKFILNSIRSMELNLFEISEFTSKFKEELENNESFDTVLENRFATLNKSRMHINALSNCLETISGEIEDLLCKKRILANGTKETFPSLMHVEDDNLRNELLIPDVEREIIDEVLEGVPLENEKINGNPQYSDLDTFVEKSKRNANCLLNELKSVIEVRAEDWKKREKVALERRAAEGKFVFDTEDKKECEMLQYKETVSNVNDANVSDLGSTFYVNDGLDSDLRTSLSQMILRQRKTMLLDSTVNFQNEECFGD